MPTRWNTHKNINDRRDSAVIRKENRDARTPRQQLDLLDNMFGVDLGAQKERARLQKMISG